MRRAVAIDLNKSERHCLEQLQRGRRVSVRLAERAAIVLLAADGLENQDIAAQLGITRQKAGRWRTRYAECGLAGIEKDAPRPGRRRRIDDQQRAVVVRKTLRETPQGQTHWSRTTMATATGLSPSTIGRIWREHGLKPHLIETFKLSNDPQFVEADRGRTQFFDLKEALGWPCTRKIRSSTCLTTKRNRSKSYTTE